MATIQLTLSGSCQRNSISASAGPKTATGSGSTIQAEASCSVTYNSTSKTYSIGSVYLKLKGQPSGQSINISGAFANDTSGNWSSFKFNPSKSSGSMTIYWTSYTSVTYSASTVSVSDTYTNNTKDVSATLTFTFKVQTTQGTEYYTIYVYLDFRLYGGKLITYTVSYYNNNDFGGGLISSATYNSGATAHAAAAVRRSLDAKTYSYWVTFDTRGGVPVPDSRDKSVTQSRRYTFDGWKGSYQTLSANQSFIVSSNQSYTEQYHIDYGNITYKTIGSLSAVNRKGYKKTNIWYDQNGAQVSGSTQVTESLTLHPEWEPIVYNVRFDLAGGKLKEEDGRISEYAFSKTYGVGCKLPDIVPQRLGYSFAGWWNQAGTVTPQREGSTMDDRVYNATYTDYSSGPVTLYAKWDLKPNTVWFDYWYNTQDSNPSHDVHIYKDNPNASGKEYDQYNITQSMFEYGQPKKGSRTGDYVFLGWSDVLPDEYNDPNKVNDGYHGVYNIPPDEIKTQAGEVSSIDLPLQLNPSDYKTYDDWGINETYYGIWAKTGKYVKINGVFKKVSTAYVKIDGTWRKIVGAWSKVGDVWKKEV